MTAIDNQFVGGNSKLYASITSLVMVLSILGYAAVAPFPLFFDISSRYISIPFRVSVLMLALILIAYGILSKKYLSLNLFWSIWWIFWISYICRLFIDYLYNPQVLRLTVYEYLAYIFCICLLPSLSVLFFSKIVSIYTIKKYFFIVTLMAIFLNCFAIYSLQDDISLIDSFDIRQGTATLNPISFAHVGVSLVLVCLCSIFQPTSAGLGRRIFTLGALLLGLLAVFLGASRGPMLSLIILAPIAIFFNTRANRPKHISLLIRLFLASLATIFFFLVVLGIDIFPSIMAITRMKTLFEDSERKELYLQGLSVFLENPLLGAGVEPIGYYPHNTILESFMLNGVASGFLYLFLIARTSFLAYRGLCIEPYASWLPILFFQYLIADMVSGSLYGASATWVLMSFIVARYQH